jgi:prepilin-type N-terminal cleavage/methylation domain-containing protein
MMRTSQTGFTLVELLIVVIIVGILAAVAIPMYSGSTERARATECVAALGTVRCALRNYYAEHLTYANANFTDGDSVTNGDILNVSNLDLDARYFSAECYTFDGDAGATTYSIKCDGSASTATDAGDVAGVVRYMDENGTVTNG